jgi:hypothetical protein
MGALHFDTLVAREQFYPAFYDFTLLMGSNEPAEALLPVFESFGSDLDCLCNVGAKGTARVHARWKGGTWRVKYTKGSTDLARSRALTEEVVNRLRLPVRETGEGPTDFEHTAGGELVIQTGFSFSCELPSASSTEVLAAMHELQHILSVPPTTLGWSAHPHAPHRDRDAGNVYDRVVAASVECHRADVLYKFLLAQPELERLYELCRRPKDAYSLRACSFGLLDLPAWLEIEIDMQGFRPVVHVPLTKEPSKKRFSELTLAVEELTGLSAPRKR